jgi:hypothetical protein
MGVTPCPVFGEPEGDADDGLAPGEFALINILLWELLFDGDAELMPAAGDCKSVFADCQSA